MNAANSTSRGVYLPAGNWYDYWTNTKHAGGQSVTWSNSDATKMPLFVREGAIIPMLQNVPQTLCDENYVNNPAISTRDTALQFLTYPPGSGSFEVFDGTKVEQGTTGAVTTVSINSAQRPISLKVLASAPAGVERNGIRLPEQASEAAYNASSLGWRYDSASGFLFVKLPHPGGVAVISFGPNSSGDGVPESWRNYHGITQTDADDDGDGLSNRDEYRAGTNPKEAQSRFVVSSFDSTPGGAFRLRWRTVEGLAYRVEWRNDLLVDSWHRVSPDVTGTGSTVEWSDEETAGGALQQRFYRIVVP
jgi:hypothetical protein